MKTLTDMRVVQLQTRHCDLCVKWMQYLLSHVVFTRWHLRVLLSA